jgi:HAD superfamily hydrolase (TIGR01549 family)
MIEAAIFDVDGTLVDSVDLHARAWQIAFEKFGKTIPFQDVRRQIGKGADQLLPVFLTEEELNRLGRQLDEYRGELFKREYLPRVKGFPKVRQLFEHIRSNGKRIALASSAKGDELEAYKKIAGIDDFDASETSSDDADRSKPYPDIFRAALSGLKGIAPDAAIVIGDTPYDAEAATSASLKTIGLLCGGWAKEELLRAGCLAVYRDPEDLLDRYGSSPLAAR